MIQSQFYKSRRAVAFAVCLPILILAFAACSDREDDGYDDDEATQTQASMQEDMEAFESDVEASLNETGQELEEIGQRIENAGDELGAEIESDFDDLRQRREDLETDFDSLKAVEGEEGRDAREELRSRVQQYEHDLRVARLKAIESKEEFVGVAKQEVEEVDKHIRQLEQRVSQMDSTQAMDHEDELANIRDERQDLDKNFDDLMATSRDDLQDARAAMAEDVAALRSEVDELHNELGAAGRSPSTADIGGDE